MKKRLLTIATIMALALIMTVTAGCSKENADETAQTETEAQASSDGAPTSYGKITLGEYKGLEATQPSTEVEDSEIENYIEDLLSDSGELVEVDRAAQEGDTVNIDYIGTKDGEAFAGGTAEGYDLTLGSGTFINGFEDGLIGTKKGDEKVLHLTFPEDYSSEDLAGQAVEFAVTVNAVQEYQTPELTDEWVSEYTGGELTSVEGFRKELKEQFVEARIQNAKTTVEQQLAEAAAANAKFEIDPDALQYQQDLLWSTYEQYAQAYGMTVDDYFAMYGTTVDEAKDDLAAYAQTLCEQRLLVDAIFDAEKLTVTDETRDELAAMYGVTYDELVEAYGEEEVEITCRQQQVYNFLYDNAVIK